MMPAFSASDLRQALAQEIGVVDRNRRDDAGERPLDHIGGVEPAAEPDFEDQHIGGMPGKQQQRRRGGDFKHRNRGAFVGLFAFLQRADEFGVGDQPPFAMSAQTNALVEAHQMRRRIDMHPSPRRFQHRPQERNG